MSDLDFYKNERFGSLTISEYSHTKRFACGTKRHYFLCICDCGKSFVAQLSNLKSGNTKSCGCLAIKSRTSHGMSKTRFYSIWRGIVRRCTKKGSSDYQMYGAVGITVCDKWLSFEGFMEDMLDGYDENLEIDRIDNSKGYCIDNCRWASESVQAYNQGLSNRNTSGKTGVSFNAASKKFIAYISVNCQNIYLGRFSKFKDAKAARVKAEIKYYGDSKL